MRVRFWGTRGSLPVALDSAGVQRKLAAALARAAGRDLGTPEAVRAFIEAELPFATAHTWGGNTACVQLDAGGPEDVLCDLGTGVRPFGQRVMATGGSAGRTFNVFMSHVHWDHIMGFPFFAPAYVPGTRIRIHGCHDTLEAAFRRQHAAPSFPVDFSRLGAAVEFVRLAPGPAHEVAGFRVRAKRQHHAGESYAWRFERDGRAIVYATDSEHRLDDPAEAEGFVEFFRDADLVIFDAMYSLADAISVKEDWGHSSNVVGVELCQRAGARHLCLFHHEPVNDDETLATLLEETRRLERITRRDRPLEVSSAYDGLEIEL